MNKTNITIVQNKFLHSIKRMIEHPSCRNLAPYNHRKNKAVLQNVLFFLSPVRFDLIIFFIPTMEA